jgi:hypothetical protein
MSLKLDTHITMPILFPDVATERGHGKRYWAVPRLFNFERKRWTPARVVEVCRRWQGYGSVAGMRRVHALFQTVYLP